jgi:catechol 1,2-dioxygenase
MSYSEDPFTENVANHAGPKADERAKVIFSSLIRHLHAFAREVQLTNEEWLAACDQLIEAGKISGAERNEMILISDVLGLEALLDTMTQDRLTKSQAAAATDSSASSGANLVTMSAILGPFYRTGAPEYPNGQSMVLTKEEGDVTARVHGRLTDVNGNPIVGAKLDIWHTGTNGLYDSQVYDPKNPEKYPYFNWRGRYTTDENGNYDCYCLKPTAYPIPYDYAAGRILAALDRSPMRPSHTHFYVTAEGYHPLVTQIYDSECPYVKADSVFAVKDSLIVDFKKSDDPRAQFDLKYDIVLAKKEQ